jgi:hypothetical protein
VAHYAILVAITWYPELTELKGPENDVEDIREWLREPLGGNLDEDKVTVIKSSDFPKVNDRSRAQPAEIAFKKALADLLFQPDGISFKNKVGERLYLFFAGHGFVGKRLAEAALYTAQASRIDPDHIASKRYAEKIANSGAFDEVVLMMDCCRDVDLSDSIRDPVLKVPDRAGLANTKFMEAYAAGRGQQAREREIVPGGPVRGLFSYVFVDALRNAKGNVNDEVTGAVLKGHILDRWPKLFDGPVPYEPDIAPPTGAHDIVFVRRQTAPKVEVRFKVNPPVPPAGSVITIENTSREVVDRVPYNPAGTRTSLPDSIYKAKLDGRSALIDASGQSVEVTI